MAGEAAGRHLLLGYNTLLKREQGTTQQRPYPLRCASRVESDLHRKQAQRYCCYAFQPCVSKTTQTSSTHLPFLPVRVQRHVHSRPKCHGNDQQNRFLTAPRVLNCDRNVRGASYDTHNSQAPTALYCSRPKQHNCNATCCASNVTGRPLNKFGLPLDCRLNVLLFKNRKVMSQHPPENTHAKQPTTQTHREYVLVLQ